MTPEQINKLPTSSRNFLELAQLAPGVTVSEDRINATNFRTIQAGGQSANAVNLFIDGTSYKNDLTGGGIAGQDASRGNPFPQNAIKEYRVISQNFKAEYQKASSAVITATTKDRHQRVEGQRARQLSEHEHGAARQLPATRSQRCRLHRAINRQTVDVCEAAVRPHADVAEPRRPDHQRQAARFRLVRRQYPESFEPRDFYRRSQRIPVARHGRTGEVQRRRSARRSARICSSES